MAGLAQPIAANTPPKTTNLVAEPTAADRAWTALLTAKNAAEQLPDKSLGTLATRRLARATNGKSVADQARSFYLSQPNHDQAAEARKLEIFSLIEVITDGDDSVSERLDRTVAEMRSDTRIPASIRAKCAAAYEFTRALRGIDDPIEQMTVTEKTARGLLKEFPAEPQGYEAIFAVCKATAQKKSEQLARELTSSSVPAEIKSAAQTLLDRYALVDRPISEIVSTEGATLLSAQTPGTPIIVYSWAANAAGSMDLGRMIQGRRFSAIGVCLDDRIEPSQKAARDAGLGGQLCYDAKGAGGVIATRLKFNAPGQIYLVDSQGIIREVRGGDSLESKLQKFGFKTPALVRP